MPPITKPVKEVKRTQPASANVFKLDRTCQLPTVDIQVSTTQNQPTKEESKRNKSASAKKQAQPVDP